MESVEQRNMRNGIVHGAFFNMATAFADPYAIIPLFLAGFTDSKLLIGFMIFILGTFRTKLQKSFIVSTSFY